MDVIEGKAPILNTVIEIGDRVIVRIPLAANKFIEYDKRKTSQSILLANEWLLYEAFQIDGRGVTEEQLKGLKARDRMIVSPVSLANPKVICHDDLPINKSGDFTIKGNRFTEKENSGDYVTQLISKAAEDPYNAGKWGIKNMFLMNGEPIKDSHFELPDPEGIGFGAMSIFFRWIQSLLVEIQEE